MDMSEGNQQGGETILIVDDEQVLLDLIEAILSRNGYKVLIAKDGLQAIEQYKTHQNEIVLIFSDVGMPNLNGYDMFMRLKEINPSIRVIIGSGYIDDNQKDELLKSGVKRFIPKPYNPPEMLKTIREVLDSTAHE